LIGSYSFLRISGELSVNLEYKKRIEHKIDLRGDHDCWGIAQGYGHEGRRRRGSQF
jgi:hypothetical protein